MKKWLIRGAAALIVIVLIALVLPFLIPVGAFKGQIVERVKAATGRDFAINGPMSLSLLPRFALEVNDVSLGNAPGMSDKTMAHLAKLELQVQPLALISGKLVIDSFVLIDPKIALEVDKQGRPNWQFAAVKPAASPAGAGAPPAPSSTSPPQAGTQAAKPSASFLEEAHLGDVRLVNGTITYFDARTGKKQQVDKINAKLALPDLGSPMQVSGQADWNSKTIDLVLDLAQPRQFLAGEKSPASVKLSAPAIKFDFKGNIASAQEVTLAGDTSVDIPSVRELAVWTGGTLPPTSGGLGPLKIDGKLDLAGSKVSFSGAQIALDAIKAKGNLAFDGSGQKPYLKGALDIDRLDLNPYLPPPSGAAGAKPAAATGTVAPTAGGAGPSPQPGKAGPAAASNGWSDQPIDMSGLNVANADLALTTGGIVFHQITIGKSALAVQLKDGRLSADLSQMQLYDGSGTGKVSLDGAASVPALQASFDLTKVQAEPLLRDAMDFDRLTGNANGSVGVTGHGRSQRELIGTLGGKGVLHFADGAIKGINIGALVHNPAGALLDANAQKNDQTGFSELNGTFTIANGILDNKDLQLTSPVLSATGAGTVDLPQRSVNYRIEPRLGSTGAGGVVVPVLVQGPWDNLSYRPQLDQLMKNPEKALEGFKGILQNPGGAAAPGGAAPNPGTLLKNLFGAPKQ